MLSPDFIFGINPANLRFFSAKSVLFSKKILIFPEKGVQ